MLYTSLFVLTFPGRLLTSTILKHVLIGANFLFFLQSVYLVHFMGVTRASGYINAIPFSNICATASVMLFVFFIFETKIKFRLLESAVFCCSLVTIIYSGTRGVWLSFMISFFFINLVCYRQIKQYFSQKYLIAAFGVIMAVTLITAPIALERINRSKEDFNRVKQGDFQDSIGLRLQVWKAGIYTIKQDGIWGAKRPYMENLAHLVEIGVYPKENFTNYKREIAHYHNTYLDKFVKYGVQGVAVWLCFVFFPLVAACKIFNTRRRTFCLTAAPITVYMISALTDMPFLHSYSLSFFIAVTYAIYCLQKYETEDAD